MKQLNKKRLVVLAFVIILVSTYLVWQNNAIEVSTYTFSESTVPQAFDGFKIVQVSDLHNKDFGNQLNSKVSEENPDLIVVTGDVIDRNRTDIPTAVEAMEDLVEMAPVYFVSGNHEVASGEYDTLKDEMDRIGVINLDNAIDTVTIDEAEIGLIGIKDPLLLLLDDVEEAGSGEALIQRTIEQLTEETGTEFNVLLSHRAELMDVYAETTVDITLTGHAHGGQIRLPFIDGLFAPSQGFLPEYTNGIYEKNGSQMVVSRGLGNSIFPLRINNRPEIVVVTLESE